AASLSDGSSSSRWLAMLLLGLGHGRGLGLGAPDRARRRLDHRGEVVDAIVGLDLGIRLAGARRPRDRRLGRLGGVPLRGGGWRLAWAWASSGWAGLWGGARPGISSPRSALLRSRIAPPMCSSFSIVCWSTRDCFLRSRIPLLMVLAASGSLSGPRKIKAI